MPAEARWICVIKDRKGNIISIVTVPNGIQEGKETAEKKPEKEKPEKEKPEKKTAQKTIEGGEAEPKEIPCEAGAGILLSLNVVDVATHQKRGGYYTIPLFAQIGSGSNRMMTANINISNLKKEGMEFLTKALGVKPTMKTPIMGKIFIPKGALLEHWNENAPSDGDAKVGEKEGNEGQ